MCSVLSFGQAIKFASFNIEECAFGLTVLLKREERVPLTELLRVIQAKNPISLLFQMQEIEGVLLLTKEPIGFKLSQDLRDELAGLYEEVKTESDYFSENHSQETHLGNDQYSILGLDPPCSLDQIKAAYRQCMKECHPDKFTNEAAEFRQWAEERAKAINAAYEALIELHSTTKSTET